jgi:hypothetical protein
MKAGDKIYLAVGNSISFCEVVGFRDYCTELKSGDFPIIAARYYQGLFYGFGYSGMTKRVRHLFLKKWWHYYPAVICERIRVNMPDKLAKRLKLKK